MYLIISRTPFPNTTLLLMLWFPSSAVSESLRIGSLKHSHDRFCRIIFTLRPSNWHHPHEPSSWLQKAERNRLMPQNRVTNKCSCQSLVSSQETPLNPPWLRNASLIATLSTLKFLYLKYLPTWYWSHSPVKASNLANTKSGCHYCFNGLSSGIGLLVVMTVPKPTKQDPVQLQ